MNDSAIPSLCKWCRENPFGERMLQLLDYACSGKRRERFDDHTRSGQPFYFWTSGPWHSGYDQYFSRSFQAIMSDADAGCSFCALLVAGAKGAPPKRPEQCHFSGPQEILENLGDVVDAARKCRMEASTSYTESFLRDLDPDWKREYSYGEVVAKAVEAGLPPESVLFSYKTRSWEPEDSSQVWVPPIYGGVLGSSCDRSGSEYDSFQIHDSGASTPADPNLMHDFGFTLIINEPWDCGTVCWPYKLPAPTFGVEFSKCYFRLYPTEPREHWAELAPATQREVVDAVTQIWEENEEEELSGTDSLVRDGLIFQLLMEDCISCHEVCAPSCDNDLPQRLLKISGSIQEPSVQLVEVQRDAGDCPKYACLSYCWGGPQPGMTIKENLDSYLKDIAVTEVPKTIQDAITVTQSLGIVFLWVDAFCIVQDSDDDKIVELGKMASIYRGAYCTIAVMSASAATGGFLDLQQGGNGAKTLNINIDAPKISKSLGRASSRIAILELRNDFGKPDLSKEPLVTRAWTFQEALLSPRLLMYFSAGQRPVLRCASRVVRSDGGIIPYMPMELSTLDLNRSIGNAPASDDKRSEDSYHAKWKSIVHQYTKRSVTVPTDRLPALSGIVGELETRTSLGSYVVGMWSNTLRYDLLWEVEERDPIFHARHKSDRRTAHTTYVGPSWSWVSRNHSIFYSLGELNSGPEPEISWSIDPVDAKLPNGAIKSARLAITCLAKEVDVPDDWKDGDRDFFFDDNPRPLGIGAMWLLHLADYEPYNNAYSVGLGVVKVETRPDNGNEVLYKRIGMYTKGVKYPPTSQWSSRSFILV